MEALERILPEGIPFPGTRSYSFFARSRIMQAFYRDVALDVVREVGRGRILDVGTGPGYLPLQISRMIPKSEVIGVDISRDMIKIARRNAERAGIGNVRFLLEDANRMSFENETFDLVVSTGSLHHWKNPVRVINEIYRVLKSGKKALIYDLWRDAPKKLLKEKLRECGYSITAGLIMYSIVKAHSSITAEEVMRILGEKGNMFRKYSVEEGWSSYPVVKVTLLKV